MVGFPSSDRQQVYKFLQPHIRDAASADLKMPAAYMFNDVPPELEDGVDRGLAGAGVPGNSLSSSSEAKQTD